MHLMSLKHIMNQQVILYTLVFAFAVLGAQSTCQQGVNCHLPECFCNTFKHPIDRHDIPQMVYFGFDDAVTPETVKYYDFLFRQHGRTNPNGCPIGITLYVSRATTHYDILKDFYQHGYELGVHSVSHGHIDTGEMVSQEAKDERADIAKLAGVPEEEIVGWRSPDLRAVGDEQIEALQNLGYTYDISMTYGRLHMNDDNPWPLTLDYGWPFSRAVCAPSCPVTNHSGFWVVPVNGVILNSYPCVYLDSCYKRPTSIEDGYKFIMDNFKSHYKGNRAPFGIHMHVSWFYHPFTKDAMDKAITAMLEYNDVYIITVQQVLEWMKHPTGLWDIHKFEPWDCGIGTKMDALLPEVVALILSIFLTVVGISSVIVNLYRKRMNRKQDQYHALEDLTSDNNQACQ